MGQDTAVFARFIQEHTRLTAPPLTPDIRLHLADVSLPVWQAAEILLGRQNVPPPYWAFAWAGGQALARYILDNPLCAAGRRVLDPGCGSGLAAIAAARSGAARTVAADIDPVALTAVRLNAAANAVSVETENSGLPGQPPGNFDLVLIGDLFYERDLALRTLAFATAAQRAGALVLAGDPGRNYFPAARFERIASYAVPVSRDLEDLDSKLTGVFSLAEGA